MCQYDEYEYRKWIRHLTDAGGLPRPRFGLSSSMSICSPLLSKVFAMLNSKESTGKSR